MNKLKKAGVICTLVAASLLPNGCATVVGTAAGPITDPISVYTICRNRDEGPAVTAILLAMGVISGPLYGGIMGAKADVYFLTHGEYPPHYDFLFPWFGFDKR